ncbi:heavy-metal-associated domain-containing protein [Malacoplasma iowae]|uniref:Heavy-metal-associated domain-containing protein n=1 Tax=Malacoplasma iowae 695 TaxID=1048830 RepID=A0A6P1LJ71_MALIO|nr:heavy-metal-associated domain-containing protein [Malacoplasma iowae]VEU61683.1 Copper chaperone [Mycoplasmopsis fermentans]EGZ31001.1 Heavy metal transport/detoxification protein [Malacoplasma iowae 695]QHG90175.1 heavy-metal-associated domain-containing protein [Malacoplasma iowae 695]WPL36076.1 heavy-metal-associated domain-containing protein [Malacoplasma iowae]WPL36466.1 heavy-metal-associated domain-containing protein [Malacoplasma iowae]
MTSISFYIKEMSCSNCSENLIKALNKNGFDDVEIDFADRVVTINFDETKFDIQNIKEVISKNGFTPKVVD